MSGWSDSQDCPKCGSKDTLMTFGDHKPRDTVGGECLECGFEYHTVEGQMTLDDINIQREEIHDMEPLTKLKDQIMIVG